MMKARCFTLLAGLVLAGTLAGAAGAATSSVRIAAKVRPDAVRVRTATGYPIVEAPAGVLVGVTDGGMDTYRGIPYALPPTGALRWQPPQPRPPRPGVLFATHFANHCPQTATDAGIASTTEDCLYLNVFAPAGTGPTARLPVMVWFHGGGFSVGESDDYKPDKLVTPGRVIVTVNYRLGRLGFLATTGLQAESHLHVNYGIMDQQAALRWVQANIGAFGGDASNVTIFGQSAGGASVYTHMFSPLSKGLFAKAIIHSGSYSLLTTLSLASALANGNAFATSVGCAVTDTNCLRAVGVQAILAAPGASGAEAFAGGLAVDGTILPQAPLTALATLQYTRVPVIQSTTHDEFRNFVAELFDLSGGPLTAAEYPVFTQETLTAVGLGTFTPLVLAEYPLSNYPSPDVALATWVTDAAFSTPAQVSDALLPTGMTYGCQFDDPNMPNIYGFAPVSFPLGAYHASDLPTIWDSYTHSGTLSPAEQQLSFTIVDYWTRFAAAGQPNAWYTPFWLPSLPVADFNEFLPPGAYMSTAKFALDHKTTFWTALAGILSVNGAVPGLPGGLAISRQRLARAHFVTLEAVFAAARERQSRLHVQSRRPFDPHTLL